MHACGTQCSASKPGLLSAPLLLACLLVTPACASRTTLLYTDLKQTFRACVNNVLRLLVSLSPTLSILTREATPQERDNTNAQPRVPRHGRP